MPARLAIAALVAIFVALSCYRQQEVPPGDRPDSDSDSDTDSDGDSDSDGDDDGDTDADGDCGHCPVNSGYPCPCAATICDDGAMCWDLSNPQQNTSGHGTCAAPCSGPGDTASCEVDMGCEGVGVCLLTIDNHTVCSYICEEDDDRPTNMYCDSSVPVITFCYGY